MATHEVQVTQINKGVNPVIHVVQGDSNRTIVATVADASIAGSASMSFERPDGTVYTANCRLDDTASTITADLTSDMLNVAGNAKATFKVTSSNKTVSTFILYVAVEPSAGFGQTPSSASNKIYVYVNGSSVEIAKQADLTSLASRVTTNESSISTISTKQTADETELQNIRVKADGTTATSAGNAVREQISAINGDLAQYLMQKTVSTNLANPDLFTLEKRLANSGSLTSASGYCASDYIEIGEKLTIYIDNGYAQYNNPIAIRFYDNAKSCNTSYNTSVTANKIAHSVNIPNGMEYIRISWEYKDGVDTNNVYVGSDDAENFVYSDYGETSVVVYPSAETKEARGTYDTLNDRLNALTPPSQTKKLIYWGDSLTEGNQAGDGGSRPTSMSALLGDEWEVFNFGRGGDKSNNIACRQGGMNLVVKPNQTIPASGSVVLDIEDNFGNDVGVRIYNVGGNGRSLNPCYINGIKGNLMRGASNYPLNKAEFTRAESGNAVTLTRPTSIISNGATEYSGYPCIIFIGQNQGFDTSKPETLLNQVKNMVRWANTDKYLVIGLCHQNSCTWQINCNDLLREEFGRKFIDIEKYLKTPIYDGETIISSYAMSDENLTPTSDDLTNISNNQYPSSIMHDGTHFNKYGYECIAKLEYQRGKELGYWD